MSADDVTRPPSDGPASPPWRERAVQVATDPPHLRLVSTSQYVQLDEVGRGGLGRIVRARDTRTGRMVAIKEMRVDSADAAARFVDRPRPSARARAARDRGGRRAGVRARASA